MKSCSALSSKLDRKTIERNRRMQMKGLCFKLASLIPRHYNLTKELLTQQDRLDHAASYIKELRRRVEELKRRKEEAMNIHGINNDMSDTITIGSNLPVLELRDLGQSLQEVTLITVLNNNFMFYEVISILSEEGAEVVNASLSVVGDKVFHTIHSQAIITQGYEAVWTFNWLSDSPHEERRLQIQNLPETYRLRQTLKDITPFADQQLRSTTFRYNSVRPPASFIGDFNHNHNDEDRIRLRF